ncbi:MAG: phospholipid carrier-dependent glycosyltransferase [Candidatus Hydrogenedentes bacterium]|nr:phospholipid carrier-dependent glycosyltransferase [Candidatus Hydrogenedentota bacterium]
MVYLLPLFIAFLVSVLLAAGYQYWLVSRGLYAVSKDDSLRTMGALIWMKDKWPLHAEEWLPLPQMIFGAAMSLDSDMIVAPRVTTHIAGLLALVAIGLLAHGLWRRRDVTVIALLLGVVFAPRAISSVVPLAEAFFYLSVTLAMFFFWLFVQRPHWLYSLATGLSLAVACSIRYEAWVIAGVVFLVGAFAAWKETALTRPAKITAIAVMALTCFCFPVYWMLLWLAETGTLGFLSVPGDKYKEMRNPEHSYRVIWLDAPLHQFLITNLASLNLLGLLGVFMAWRERPRFRWWFAAAFVSFVLIALLGALGHALPLHNFWRVPATWSVLLLPATAYALVRLGAVLSRVAQFRRNVFAPLLCALVLGAFHFQTMRVASQPYGNYTPEIFEVSELLSHLFGEFPAEFKPRVLIEGEDATEWAHIRIATQDPGRFVWASTVGYPLGGEKILLSRFRKLAIGLVITRRENWPRIQHFFDERFGVFEFNNFIVVVLPEYARWVSEPSLPRLATLRTYYGVGSKMKAAIEEWIPQSRPGE